MNSVAAPRKPLAELAEREFLKDLVRLPTISARGARPRAPRAIACARTPRPDPIFRVPAPHWQTVGPRSSGFEPIERVRV